MAFLLFSCSRPAEKEPVEDVVDEIVMPPGIPPMAVLQAGEYPLWFQFTENGPALIETIYDAVLSAPLIPWPLTGYVRFMLVDGDDLLMAVNRDSILRFSPWVTEPEIGLYRYSGGELWKKYTVGAFALIDQKPTALLYNDERFLDSGVSPPAPRLWTYDIYSANLISATLPVFDNYPPDLGWDIDAFRRSSDGYWYFRAIKKKIPFPELYMLRSGNLAGEGEEISLGAFQNAALPEPLSDAAEPLRGMLSLALTESDSGIAAVIAPNFPATRYFATDREKTSIYGFYSKGLLLATDPQGNASHSEAGTTRRFSLPSLPEGFVYTGIGLCADTIIATWEEQNGYSTGAAGFMVIR